MERCKIRVNGREIEVDANRKLMDILRNECGLKSVKDGCSEGACGTCTVLIDGKAVKTCVQRAEKVIGKSIVTVEGLTKREQDVYVYAFGEAGAVQCGFCIPGMVICAKALLDSKETPSRLEIVNAISNNICRCTGYKKIVDAIALAGKIFRDNLEIGEHTGPIIVGSNLHRIDAKDKVLGSGQYVDDMDIPEMIYGGAVRSQYPRAIIKAIHTEKAMALQGVVCVLTADDVPGSNKVGHIKQDWDTMIAVGGTTRYVGDAICIIAAETPAILEKAKNLIDIDYEPLGPITCPKEALQEGAPLVHSQGNILKQEHLVRGNAEEVIATAKYKVTNHYETPWTEHAFLEPEAAIAMPFDEGIFIYSSDQGTYDTRHECSLLLGIPPEKIIVENKLVGGGFGGKEDVTVQHHAALIAYVTKKTVKVKLTRKESLIVHPKRHPMSIDMTTACDENGYLTAMKATVISDTGAYASLGGPVLQRACTHAAGPYNYQVIDIEGTAVYTNNPPAGAFRGFGVTQTCFATESNLDMLAEMVGISPWEMRYRNAIRPGQVLPNGQIADESTGLVQTLESVKEAYEKEKYAGIACAMKNAGIGVGNPDFGRVRLVVKEEMVHIYTGASCIGQGLGTVLVQMCCETLGINASQVVYHAPNTGEAPDSGTTSGSRQTLVTGEACRVACEQLKQTGSMHLIRELEGQEFVGIYDAKTDKMGAEVPNPISHVAYGYATQVCVLNEDGTVKKIIASHDVGKAVNPRSVEGQIEGGVVMGMGYALTETYPLSNCIPTGKFGTIGLLRANQIPELQSVIVEREGIPVAYGAVGIGEITSIPTAPAIRNAYYQYDGICRTELPLKGTPYQVKTKKDREA